MIQLDQFELKHVGCNLKVRVGVIDQRGNQTMKLSIVSPMYNESGGIAAFLHELRQVLDSLTSEGGPFEYEVILVDDGSTDDSIAIANSMNWLHCRVLALSRNCGHQIALEAGISVARGQWVVTMDADGQHPPEVIGLMLDLAMSGQLDVVYAVQAQRRTDSWSKRAMAGAYYAMVRALTGILVMDSQADFRLMSSRVIEDIRFVPGDKVLRLLLPSVGYRSDLIRYEVRDRFAGKGRFGLRHQISLASSSILNFSAKPLRLVAAAGTLISFGAFLWLIYVIIAYTFTRAIDGWASVMAAVLIVGGLTLLSVSIVGEYVARIHELLRRHPRYSAHWIESDNRLDLP